MNTKMKNKNKKQRWIHGIHLDSEIWKWKIYFYKLVSILYKRVIEDSYESKGSLSLWEKSYDRREDSSSEKKKKWVTGKRRGERVTEKRMKR